MTEFYAPGLDTKTASEEGRPMIVHLADGTVLRRKDKEPVRIWLYGVDSRRYKEAYRDYTRAVMVGRAEDENYDPEDDLLAYLAAMTARWNVQLLDGKDAPCTPEVVKAFLSQYPVAKDQADKFIVQRANFMNAPSES